MFVRNWRITVSELLLLFVCVCVFVCGCVCVCVCVCVCLCVVLTEQTGTAPANIEKIKLSGLLVPGKEYPGIGKIGHATDSGFWGKGIYLSPNASVSIGYCRGGSVLLINAVLMGKIFKCTGLINGQPLVAGFDSHTDPSGNEFVLFDECQVLPCYAVVIKPKGQ
jgi:hypothetical protein